MSSTPVNSQLSQLSPELIEEINILWKSNVHLLCPVYYNNENHEEIHKLYSNVISLAFDIPDKSYILVDGLIDRDLLWLPISFVNPKEKDINSNPVRYNYFQLYSAETLYSINPINNILSYLFTEKDYFYGESYEFNLEELKARDFFYRHIGCKYKDANQYVLRVKRVLFMDQPKKDFWISSIEKVFKTTQDNMVDRRNKGLD